MRRRRAAGPGPSSSLSATAASMPAPPATIKVSTGPVTSLIADGGELQSAAGAHRAARRWSRPGCGSGLRAGTGRRWRTPRAGPVTSRIWAASKVTMTTPRSTGSVESRLGRAASSSPRSSRVHVLTVRRGGGGRHRQQRVLVGGPPRPHAEDMRLPTCSTPGSPPSTWSGTFQVLAAAPGIRQRVRRRRAGAVVDDTGLCALHGNREPR